MARDHFEVLGIARAYHVDAADLEKRYLALQKETHPDRFAKALPRERMEAVVRNTELNDAYKVLKSDIKRAEYILKLEGVDIGEEKPQSTTGATKQLVVDPKLLMEIMELREELAEARVAKKLPEVARLQKTMAERRTTAVAKLVPLFDAHDLAGIKEQLILLRYLDRYLEECDAALDEED